MSGSDMRDQERKARMSLALIRAALLTIARVSGQRLDRARQKIPGDEDE
jgi:hypothetical protein